MGHGHPLGVYVVVSGDSVENKVEAASAFLHLVRIFRDDHLVGFKSEYNRSSVLLSKETEFLHTLLSPVSRQTSDFSWYLSEKR